LRICSPFDIPVGSLSSDQELAAHFSKKLQSVCKAIGHSFEAFPVIIESLSALSREEKDSAIASIGIDKGKFAGARFELMKQLFKPQTVPFFENVAKDVCSWVEIIHQHVKTLVVVGKYSSNKQPSVERQLDTVKKEKECLQNEVEYLRKMLEEAEKQNASLQNEVSGLRKKLIISNRRAKTLSDELESSRNSVRSLEKLLEEQSGEQELLGTEMTFQPKIITRGGKEVVVFVTTRNSSEFYFIANDIVNQLKLDLTKPVTILIESYDYHCHTDEDEEIALAEEYSVPKGEDFFICRGSIRR